MFLLLNLLLYNFFIFSLKMVWKPVAIFLPTVALKIPYKFVSNITGIVFFIKRCVRKPITIFSSIVALKIPLKDVKKII